jgi:membrane fusion protein
MSKTPPPLFRPAAVAAQGSHWTGKIVLARPVPAKLAAAVAVAITLAGAAFLTWGEYTPKKRVTGQLVPVAGSVRVVAPGYGRVARRLAEDDAQVAAGQPLFQLDARTDSEPRIDRLLAERHRTIEQEISARKQAIALQQQQVQRLRDKLARYRQLQKRGFVSAATLDDLAGELAAQAAQTEGLKANLLTIERDRATLDQERAERSGRNGLKVLAPVGGTVTAITVEPGQTVQAGMVLATVLPAGSRLEARLMVPTSAAGFIERGQKVLLRVDAFPYQKFGQVPGVVARVERAPLSEGEASGPLYRVTVRLDQQAVTAYGKARPFEAGMTVQAEILQDRRRLIEWIFDPLTSAAKGLRP